MQIFKVEGMTCEHCVRALSNALQAVDPAAHVQIDLHIGQVKVQSQQPAERLLAAIIEQGYPAEPLAQS
jgi:copper chaperone